MNNKPQISAIITDCNHGKHMTKFIHSVLSQTYKKAEPISNEDSTDNSYMIIKETSTNIPSKTSDTPAENKLKENLLCLEY